MLVCGLLGCAPRPTARETVELSLDARGCASPVARLPQREVGFCFAHDYHHGGARGYGSREGEASLEAMADVGATAISVTPFGFTAGVHDPDVRLVTDHGPGETDARVRATIRAAHARGLRVLLKPHLWLGDGRWVGELALDDPNARARFMRAYGAFIAHYARMAEEEHVASFAIGVELKSATRVSPDLLTHLAAIVRPLYHGELVYAANWDEVAQIRSWDAVDVIGVQLYAPLAARRDADDATMRAALVRVLDALGRFARTRRMPLVLTEVGYRADPDALVRPHLWPEGHQAEPDEHTQARGFRLLADVLASRRDVRGVYVWKWFTDPASRDEGPTGFSPRGRRAEAVLRTAFGSRRCRGG